MTQEQQEVAEQIRSGKYFDEARGWYQALYIGPISERTFFLMVAGLAGLIALVGFIAFLMFMPITQRPGLLVRTADPDRLVMEIERIRPRAQPLERAMERFMLQTYVERRESYIPQDYEANLAFTRAQSDAPTYAAYDALYGRANPRSPVNILGAVGRRYVTVQFINVDETVEPKLATVKFSTELEGVGVQAKTQWTATLGYYYSPMQPTEMEDPATGELRLTVEDPQLKVVNYAVTQTP